MRKFYLIAVAIIALCSNVFAQAPHLVNYQGVACDRDGAALVNQNVGIKFTILQDDPSGVPVYLEEHATQTDEFGLFNLTIGDGGDNATGNFDQINWGGGTYFLKVEMDLASSGSFQTLSTTQLISVPYALHARTAMVADSALADGDSDPTNELQDLVVENGMLSISNGGSVSINDDDSDPTNEIQEIEFDGENIILRDPAGNESSVAIFEGPFTRPGAGLQFPQGLVGEYITILDQSYTVPNDNVFYVTAAERFIEIPALGEESYTAPNMPVFPGGTVLRNCNCSGFLVQEDAGVEAIIIDFTRVSSYVVPADKALVLKSGFDGLENISLVVNGRTLRYDRLNAIKSTQALIFSAGTRIELVSPDNGLIYTGYLIDN